MMLKPFLSHVVLFGWGEWSKKRWFPILKTLADWGVIHLTVIDRWPEAPPELSALAQEGVLSYSPWDNCFEAEAALSWQAAFVVTTAHAQASVVQGLLKNSPRLKMIVCEKPGAESLEQVKVIVEACQRAGVGLLVADHYLLRPPVQYLISDPQPLQAIAPIIDITAALNESQQTGPDQGATVDLLVHLLNILLALFPNADFALDAAYISYVQGASHTTEETWSYGVGHLLRPSHPPISCQLEGGKQLNENRKEISFLGEKGKLCLDLLNNSLILTLNDKGSKEIKWNSTWTYARLILQILAMISRKPVPSPLT